MIERIECSLSLGKLLSKNGIYYISFCIGLCLIMPIISFICLFIPCECNSIEFFALVGGSLFFLCFSAVFVYLLIKDRNIKKRVTLYLDDVVELDGYCKKVDEFRMPFQSPAIKIEVSFNFNNKTINKESTVKTFAAKKGYFEPFNKYADKKVKILYSPAFDEVLFLKD